jgi:hypothetical protein
MNWKIKTGIAGIIILLIAVLIFIIKVQRDTIDRLKVIETSVVESKDIGNGIIRAQSSYVTKSDLERMLRDQGLSIEAIRKDLSVFDAEVKGVHTVTVVTPGYSGKNIETTTQTPNPNPPTPDQPLTDPNGYFSNQQWLSLTEPFGDGTGVPFGSVGFSAWQEKPWSLEILPRKYNSTTVLGLDENGRHYAYSVFQIEVDGKTYRVPIDQASLVEEYPSPKLSFNPRLYLAIDGGIIANPPMHTEIAPSIGLSLFSYGQTKTSPQWSILTVGIGYATQQKSPVAIVSPINYNIGKNLPLIDNLHIGPSISVDVKGNVGLYLGARVAF